MHLIESDPMVHESIQQLLTGLPAKVYSYPSAEEFLRSKHRSGPQCLITDIELPGMDGVELLNSLRSEGRLLPVIMLTSGNDVPSAVRAIRGGALDFLEKTYLQQRLLNRVRQALMLKPG